ncbi:NifB/NifX family molybdenum-iron cluster-binding protein [Syntrophobacter fumaroxidans]|uniref:Dinitrogenase iron-molybdenum cofactor biosynthesis n=1 Tax=Syntrophobacter fumaroxidans (strain DSM 10017 / MPOB) TaxID=335543 RepID=A0LNT3_SYNFM|nr:NifB/NifX family molybdenum-iron cluster-binding protein [Syntrophobacter fumaroxidans]ABK19085.1 Dinitrogenase iron-molybdenum cofactor biosynthesis [Syntrophobacter fumaroxidans MPOB]
MRIAVSAPEPNLDSEVYPRFGRSRYFLLIDPETMRFETVTNPDIDAPTGAGTSAAQLVYNKGAAAVITGTIGPKAHQALAAVGVRMITGMSGSIREAVARFKAGGLSSEADSATDTGTGPGAGMLGCGGKGTGPGRGMGRGRGCGGGKGMGKGNGRRGGGGNAPRR